MYKRLTFIIILCFSMGFQIERESDDTPMFFSMADEWKDIAKDELVFEFAAIPSDTTYAAQINHKVRLLSNTKGAPRLFFSEIETTVCADGECKLANINVYWNLLGNYVGYSIPLEFPLTKYEHDHFEKEDYAKLHRLLLDDNSILKRRKMSDLIDKVLVSPSDIYSKDIDGITGATKTEIKESVVKGGLYSCYTLWHLVHGEVKEKMKEHLEAINSDTLTSYFLNAPYKDYQQHALKQLAKENFKEHAQQITNIFKTTDAATKGYILKKLPQDFLSEEETAAQCYNTFPDIDINTRTVLIKKLKNAHPSAVEIVSKYTDYMTKNQIKLYFEFLNESSISMSKRVKFNLKKASNSKGNSNNYLIKQFLENKK